MTSWRHGPKPTIGVIGAIGAGKTAAAGCFAARGGVVGNADALGHEALEDPEIRRKLLARWGDRVVRGDGKLDRRAIAGIVFANSPERRALEAVVFPYIRSRAFSDVLHAQADPTARLCVLDAAVMLEAGWDDVCDKIVYVDAPRELRLARLAARSGWTADELTAREAAQLPAGDKMKRADAVIVNDAGPDRLQEQTDRVLAEWGL